MEKLKIAIVGCGGIANQKHMPSIRANAEKAEMVAFCDIIPERAQKAAEEYGTPDAKVYTDYKAMLADHEIEIDVVHVCTPNVAHCPITVAAFEAGKHVMCEKPMAHNTADARKMIEAWKKSGKKFTIGYQNRLRDDTQTLHASCENRELGEIYFAKAHALRRRAVPTWGVFPNKALQGGGPLIDIGTHALDITLWMMNNYEPLSVSGQVFYKLGRQEDGPEGNVFGPWDPKTYEVEDSAFGFIKMENGATIYLGDYDYYLEKKAELEELARLEAEENQVSEEVQVASAGASDYQAQKASQKEIRKLSRRIEQIENELETVEERLGKISIAMLETNDVMELSDLQKELDDLSVSQEALMEEWSDLSEQLEG